MKTLDEVALYDKVKIIDIIHVSSMKRRLLDLGFVKGNEVIPVLRYSHHGICAYFIKGCMIALRKEDAKHIVVMDDGVRECLKNY